MLGGNRDPPMRSNGNQEAFGLNTIMKQTPSNGMGAAVCLGFTKRG